METTEERLAAMEDSIDMLRATVNTIDQNASALAEGILLDDPRTDLMEILLVLGKSIESARSQIRRVSRTVAATAEDVFV